MPLNIRTAVAVLFIEFASFGHAAASPVCDQLGFQLATLSEDIEPAEAVQKYALAIEEQKHSLDALDARVREAGCSAGSGITVANECSAFAAKQARMQRNLQILEDKRQSLLSEGEGTSKRDRLVAALSENRCNQEQALISTPDEDGSEPLVRDDPNGFETIRVPDDAAEEPDDSGNQYVDLGGTSTNGDLRTMCVRTCDGAYFPVSSHASPLDFRRDAQVCSMMCPGTQTELFYHPLQSESSEMRSAVTGEAYADLATAYRFRTEKPSSKPECGCNFSLYYQEMMKRQAVIDNTGMPPKKASAIVWMKPALRPALRKDQVAENTATRERDYVANTHIRLIGPKFLPDKPIDFTRTTEIRRH